VVGVDFAAGSVDVSREQNAAAIAAGRVEIHQASVSKLPLADDAFDLVTAVETHYYWPELAGDAREIFRVLKPGGTFIAIAEAYKGSRYDVVMRPAMWLLRGKMLSKDEHRDWLMSAGFRDVQVDEDRGHAWLCVWGRKA
jgi:SAM-dependent methyltransferase